MIHYGKTPDGDLEFRVSAEDVGEVFDLLGTAGLLQRRTFDDLKTYIKREFAAELEAHRRRMTAQIPTREEVNHAAM